MGVTTCVVVRVTTCICVSSTVRGGGEHNNRMIVVSDAVAEISRDTYDDELKTINRILPGVKATEEIWTLLSTVASTR